jgi:hypothetical protein
MNMIFHAADDDRCHSILSCDAAQERPEPLLQRGGDEFAPLFGAENTMETGTDVRHAIIQSSLRDLCNSGFIPGTKVPGYFQLSLPG